MQGGIGIEHYLTVGAILFVLGVLGIFLNRKKNVIVILMAVELILLAVNLNLVAFSAFMQDLVGQVLRDACADGGGGRRQRIGAGYSGDLFPQPRLDFAVDDINRMIGVRRSCILSLSSPSRRCSLP